jgi:hypothetical protein
MHTQDMGNAQQGGDAGILGAGLDGLIGGAGHLCSEEHGFLGAVLSQARDTDAVADGAALCEEPVVVGGQAWHPTNAVPKMIISQPALSGILRS